MLKQEIDFLAKYATLAEEILTKEHGAGNFKADEVEKVAAYLIEEDQKNAEAFDAVDDLVKQAQIIANGFFQELFEKLGQEKAAELVNVYIQKLAYRGAAEGAVRAGAQIVQKGKGKGKIVELTKKQKSALSPAAVVQETSPSKNLVSDFVNKNRDVLVGAGVGGAGGVGIGYGLS